MYSLVRNSIIPDSSNHGHIRSFRAEQGPAAGRTVMVVNINPSTEDFDETQTGELKYFERVFCGRHPFPA